MTAVPGVPEEARTDEIPDEAIEAAAQALASQAAMVTQSFAEMPEYLRDGYRRAATAAVTAAAPFLTAAARASGAVEGAAAEREAIVTELEASRDAVLNRHGVKEIGSGEKCGRHCAECHAVSAYTAYGLAAHLVAARGGRAEGDPT